MTVFEAVSVLTSSGVLAGGLGLLKLGLQLERRMFVLEIKNGVKEG